MMEGIMGKVIGYMLTWTTYGTWLQGDERGYVKNGRVLGRNESLRGANRKAQKGATVRLSKAEREVVRAAILQESEALSQEVYAVAVCSDHVHIMLGCIGESIGKVAGRYKKAGTTALRNMGLQGRVWTKGYDKRFCFYEKSLKNRIAYVMRH